MKLFFGILLFFVPVVLHAQESDSLHLEAPKIIRNVEVGEKVSFGDGAIQFIKVLSDSRCPKNVTCVWAGEARVLIGVYKKGVKIKEREIVVAAKPQSFPILKNIGFLVKLSNLFPYPDAKVPITPEDYTLGLYIKTLGGEKD